jgi:protein ImuA
VAFAAILLARCGGQVLWITTEQESNLVWPPGLIPFGLAPERLILARAARWAEALWAMEEALRCSALGGAVLMAGAGQGLDLTATRRLHLAAEAGGIFGLLLRPDGVAGASAARTRWHIAPLASTNAPRWRLALLRQRGGAPAGPWNIAFEAATGTLPTASAHCCGPPSSAISSVAAPAERVSFHSNASRTTAPDSSSATMPCC